VRKSDLPQTPKGRRYEIRGQGLREFAGLSDPRERLDPFLLASYAKLLVVSFSDIETLLGDSARRQLLGEGRDAWSGGAASQRLPDGRKLIILNPTHGKNRHNATLMEEISHVFLGHKPSRLAIVKRDRKGNIAARDYNEQIEEEAYATGAAAALREFVANGMTSAAIARHFSVSRALVEYRIKVSRLWNDYKKNTGSGVQS
jgi:hypothetical protein